MLACACFVGVSPTIASAHASGEHGEDGLKRATKQVLDAAGITPDSSPANIAGAISAASKSGTLPVELDPDMNFLCKQCGKALFTLREVLEWDGSPSPDVDALMFMSADPFLQYRFAFSSPHSGHSTLGLFKDSSHASPTLVMAAPDPPAASLFPKYAQTPVKCRRCGSHVGWAYRAASSHGKQPTSAAATPTASATPGAGQPAAAATATKQPALAQFAQDFSEKTARRLLVSLRQTCLDLPTGWWTYRYCYKQHVRQIHVGEGSQVETDWSLGQYKSTEHNAALRSRDPLYFVSQFYEGGQPCDENNKHRSTEVRLQCCPGKSHNKAPAFDSIQEPSLCTYVAKVCVPALCKAPLAQPPPPAAAPPSPSPSHIPTPTSQSDQHPTQRSVEEKLTPELFFGMMMEAVVPEYGKELEWASDIPVAP